MTLMTWYNPGKLRSVIADLFGTETSCASNYKDVRFKLSACGAETDYFCFFSQPASR